MEKIVKKLSWDYSDLQNDILYKTEVEANRIAGITMFNCSIVLIIALILNSFGVFQLDQKMFFSICAQSLVELIVPAIFCFIFKGRDKKKILKWILLIEFTIVAARLDSVLSYNILLFSVVPIIMSCRYYNKKFTIIIAIVTLVVFSLSMIVGPFIGLIDRNVIDINATNPSYLDPVTGEFSSVLFRQSEEFDYKFYLGSLFRYAYIPRAMIYLIITFLCVVSAGKGKILVTEQKKITTKTARIESELGLATQIQAKMLPSIFPAFLDHKEFDIYATMNPAKEVGGDFYDFFMIDDKHLCITIADVSGKGVPAALFMVVTKTLLKNFALTGLSPREILGKTNNALLENNDLGLFVTCWLGIYDIENNKIIYSVAGHNPPLIKREKGTFEYLKYRPGLVLAGMESIKYNEYELDFNKGDILYLYTDGVTEATSSDNKLYGEDRLKDYLDNHSIEKLEDILHGLKADIDNYCTGREQFDDITMLILKSFGKDEDKYQLNVEAVDSSLNAVQAFIEEQCESVDAPMSVVMKLNIAAEEIFVNICHYAYAEGDSKPCVLEIKKTSNSVTVIFKDKGIPFNPLERKEPDVTLSADERDIGGLGIFMVKKSMDYIGYSYEDHMNILTFRKEW